MPTRPKETKSFPGIVTKTDDALGIVEAIVNVFGIVDLGDDIVASGSCKKTIAERGRKILVLDQHNTSSVEDAVAKVLHIRELGPEELPDELVREYPEATGALWVQMQFMLNDPKSRACFERVSAGLISEYSIGFSAIQTEYKKVEWRGQSVNARVIRELMLYEVSLVLWGMNPATATVGAKDAKEMTADGPQRRLGDYLHGTLRRVANGIVDDLLACGWLSSEEHKTLAQSISLSMDNFTLSLPDDIALRPMGTYFDWGWMAAHIEQETKAGRVLSASNASRILAAANALMDVLKDAGVVETAAENDADKAALAEPESAPLTVEARERLLKLIEMELETMQEDV